jgi:hypothetical protein
VIRRGGYGYSKSALSGVISSTHQQRGQASFPSSKTLSSPFSPLQADGRPSVTLEYTSKICKQAYPPGKYFQVPEVPDVEEINARGDYDIEYSRLAFIDGDRDPWRPVVSQILSDIDRHLICRRPLKVISLGRGHLL